MAPSWPRPRTGAGRPDAVSRGRPPSPAPRDLRPAGGAQRVARQECGACPAPAGAVASACRARPLPVQLALHRRCALHSRRTVHRRLHGQRRLHKAKPAAVPRGGLSRHTLRAWAKTTSCLLHVSSQQHDVPCCRLGSVARDTSGAIAALLRQRPACNRKPTSARSPRHSRVSHVRMW